MDPVQFSIDGNDPAPANTDASADMEMAATRRALTEAASIKNELLQAKREHAAVSLDRINTEAERAAQDYQQAWENGDSAKMVERQREIAALEVRRHNAQAVVERLDRAQPTPADPVEAFAAGRSQPAQEWIRSHPEFVINERKAAKLNAAHSDALSDGIAPDTPEYFAHINRFVGIEGGGAGSRRRGGDNSTLRVLVGTPKPGERLARNEVRMTPGEYKAATETLTWNYDSADGKHKKGEALGISEYLRRQGIMKQQPGWFDKLSD